MMNFSGEVQGCMWGYISNISYKVLKIMILIETENKKFIDNEHLIKVFTVFAERQIANDMEPKEEN